jgi:hypothetical protein
MKIALIIVIIGQDDLNYDPKTKLKDGLQKLYEYLII